MSDADSVIADAKQFMRAGDFESALAVLGAADLAAFDPHAAIRILLRKSECVMALGRRADSVAIHRTALSILVGSNLQERAEREAEIATLALMLAMGADDVEAVNRYAALLYRDAPPELLTFRIAHLVGVKAWAKANGGDFHFLDPPQKIATPSGEGPGRSVTYLAQATWHAAIPNAEILFGWDCVVTETGEVIHEASYLPIDIAFASIPHGYNPALGLVAHPWPDDSTFHDVDALFVSVPEKNHYGHWLVDLVPRLRAWRLPGEPRRKLVISKTLPAKHRELLTCFGVMPDDLLECEIGRRYKFRSLRIVRAGRAVAPNPQSARFLYDVLGPLQRRDQSRPKRRFFLVRDIGTRGIANGAEVDQVFEEFGIEKINPARLSCAEQKVIFADAELIVGAFGTELYCLLNMYPGSTVIELIWDAAAATVYGPMCAFVGMTHRLLVCERSGKNLNTTRKVDYDLVVDCALLRGHLAAAVSPAEG